MINQLYNSTKNKPTTKYSDTSILKDEKISEIEQSINSINNEITDLVEEDQAINSKISSLNSRLDNKDIKLNSLEVDKIYVDEIASDVKTQNLNSDIINANSVNSSFGEINSLISNTIKTGDIISESINTEKINAKCIEVDEIKAIKTGLLNIEVMNTYDTIAHRVCSEDVCSCRIKSPKACLDTINSKEINSEIITSIDINTDVIKADESYIPISTGSELLPNFEGAGYLLINGGYEGTISFVFETNERKDNILVITNNKTVSFDTERVGVIDDISLKANGSLYVKFLENIKNVKYRFNGITEPTITFEQSIIKEDTDDTVDVIGALWKSHVIYFGNDIGHLDGVYVKGGLKADHLFFDISDFDNINAKTLNVEDCACISYLDAGNVHIKYVPSCYINYYKCSGYCSIGCLPIITEFSIPKDDIYKVSCSFMDGEYDSYGGFYIDGVCVDELMCESDICLKKGTHIACLDKDETTGEFGPEFYTCIYKTTKNYDGRLKVDFGIQVGCSSSSTSICENCVKSNAGCFCNVYANNGCFSCNICSPKAFICNGNFNCVNSNNITNCCNITTNSLTAKGINSECAEITCNATINDACITTEKVASSAIGDLTVETHLSAVAPSEFNCVVNLNDCVVVDYNKYNISGSVNNVCNFKDGNNISHCCETTCTYSDGINGYEKCVVVNDCLKYLNSATCNIYGNINTTEIKKPSSYTCETITDCCVCPSNNCQCKYNSKCNCSYIYDKDCICIGCDYCSYNERNCPDGTIFCCGCSCCNCTTTVNPTSIELNKLCCSFCYFKEDGYCCKYYEDKISIGTENSPCICLCSCYVYPVGKTYCTNKGDTCIFAGRICLHCFDNCNHINKGTYLSPVCFCNDCIMGCFYGKYCNTCPEFSVVNSYEDNTCRLNVNTCAIINGPLTVNGDIYQCGETYITHAEDLYTKNDTIKLREGAETAISSGAYSGLRVLKYDGANDLSIVVDNQGVARLGKDTSLQPFALRAEETDMADGCFVKWDATNKRLITSPIEISTLSIGCGCINNICTETICSGVNGLVINSGNCINLCSLFDINLNAKCTKVSCNLYTSYICPTPGCCFVCIGNNTNCYLKSSYANITTIEGYGNLCTSFSRYPTTMNNDGICCCFYSNCSGTGVSSSFMKKTNIITIKPDTIACNLYKELGYQINNCPEPFYIIFDIPVCGNTYSYSNYLFSNVLGVCRACTNNSTCTLYIYFTDGRCMYFNSNVTSCMKCINTGGYNPFYNRNDMTMIMEFSRYSTEYAV